MIKETPKDEIIRDTCGESQISEENVRVIYDRDGERISAYECHLGHIQTQRYGCSVCKELAK